MQAAFLGPSCGSQSPCKNPCHRDSSWHFSFAEVMNEPRLQESVNEKEPASYRAICFQEESLDNQKFSF
jgi:hypothetical protein